MRRLECILLFFSVFAVQATVATRPTPRPPGVASASEATPAANDTECIDLETHCSSCKIDQSLPSRKFQQHDGVVSEHECSAKCKHVESCRGIVWNARTQSCATFEHGTVARSKEPQDIDTKILLCSRCGAQQVSPGQWQLKWSPEHLLSDNIEIATIFEGLRPNDAAFHSSKQDKIVIGEGKLVLLNNGTYLWDHNAQAGLSAKGWFSFRSLPFKHECSVPSGGSLRLETAQCSIGIQNRVNCGHDGVTNQECFAKGCCFDDSRPDAFNCFAPFARHETGRLVWWRLGRLCSHLYSKLLEYAANVCALLASLLTVVSVTSGALLVLLLAIAFELTRQLTETRQRLKKAEETGMLLARFRSLRMEMLAAEQRGRLMLTAGEQGQRCVVCWVNSPNIIFIPCGHLSCCHQCISKVWEQQLLEHHADLRCPCCQGSVLHVTFPIAIGT